jgi:hypothetical protein
VSTIFDSFRVLPRIIETTKPLLVPPPGLRTGYKRLADFYAVYRELNTFCHAKRRGCSGKIRSPSEDILLPQIRPVMLAKPKKRV